jgi:WD40 repeat protein
LPGLDHLAGNPRTDLGPATDAAVAPDGSLVSTVHRGGRVGLWNLTDRQLVGIIAGLAGPGVLIEWADGPEGPSLYAASAAGQLVRWSQAGGLTNLAVPGTVNSIAHLEVSAHSGSVAVHGDTGPVAVWTGTDWKQFEVQPWNAVALSADGRRVAVGREYGGVDVFDLDHRLLARLRADPTEPFRPEHVRFVLSDQRVVATNDPLNYFKAWDVAEGLPLKLRRQSAVGPAGSTAGLWARYFNWGAVVVDLRTGEEIAELPGREGMRTPQSWGLGDTLFDFARTGDLAAAGSAEGAIQVWRRSTGERLGFMKILRGARRIEFLPDGKSLLLVSPEGFPMIVPLDADHEFSTLCPLAWGRIEDSGSASDLHEFCWGAYARTLVANQAPWPKAWSLTAAPRPR